MNQVLIFEALERTEEKIIEAGGEVANSFKLLGQVIEFSVVPRVGELIRFPQINGDNYLFGKVVYAFHKVNQLPANYSVQGQSRSELVLFVQLV